MESNIQTIKGQYQISNIFPIAPILLQKEKIYLFFSKREEVSYSLFTDGDVEHWDTWIDKKPEARDPFLVQCPTIKRFEFHVQNANVLLLEKKYHDSMIRNLYIDENHLYKVINNHLYQVSIGSRENIMIKKIGEYYAN